MSKMKKEAFLVCTLIFFLLLIAVFYAQVPDADKDGVPDDKDKCPNTGTIIVDNDGCSCSQKTSSECNGAWCCQKSNDACLKYCIQSSKAECYKELVNVCRGGAGGTLSFNQNGIFNAGDKWQLTLTSSLPNAEVLHCAKETKTNTDYRCVKPSQRGFGYEKGGDVTDSSGSWSAGGDVTVDLTDTAWEEWVKVKDSQGNFIESNHVTASVGAQASVAVQPNVATQPQPVGYSAVTGPQSTLVILVADPSKRELDYSSIIKGLNEVVFGENFDAANDFYKKNSFDKISLTGKVVGPYFIPRMCESRNRQSDELSIFNNAISFVNRDVNVQAYDRIIIFIVNDGTLCQWPASATIGKGYNGMKFSVAWMPYSFDWLRNSVSNPDTGGGKQGLYHELGHNLGMAHANSVDCFTCDSIEYGDYLDIMGSGSGHLNAPHKEELGWLTSDNILIATEGEHLLKPLEVKQPRGAIQQIKLPLKIKPTHYSVLGSIYYASEYYTLEYRLPIDYDKPYLENQVEQVFILLSPFPSNVISPTNIVKFPYSVHQSTPALKIGQPLIDNANGYKISLISKDSDGALVKIERI